MSRVTIRLADVKADAAAIMDGAIDFRERVAFRELLPADDDDFTRAIGRIVTLDGIEILLAESGGRVVGCLGILYAPYIWNPNRLSAEELFWWTARDAPLRTAWRLFTTTMARIDERQAIPVFRALTNSPAGVARLYEKSGMEPTETVFMRIA